MCAESNQDPVSPGFAEAGLAGDRLTGLRFALAGPGRVGTSLALWLAAAGAELVAVAGRDRAKPPDPRLPPAPLLWLGELASEDCDLLLVTVADPAIEAVAEELARRPQAKVALHAAGPFDARPLAPLRRAGSAIGAFHPLRAFPAVQEAPAAGTFYGLAGDPGAVALGRRLAAFFGGRCGVVEGERRQLYHLAATLAAGGVTTVLAAMAELIAAAGLPADLLEAELRLMDGALAAVRRAALAGEGIEAFDRAITGPAARGDLATLERQREALGGLAPALLPLVTALQDEALRRGRRLRAAAGLGSESREIGDESGAKAISSPRETPSGA